MAGRRLEAGSLPFFLHSLSDGILSWHLMHETIKIKTTLSQRLTTPLQIEQYLTLAFEEAYRVGHKPVTPEIIETTLAQGLEDLEPRLVRHGYNAKNLAELLNIRRLKCALFCTGSYLQAEPKTSETKCSNLAFLFRRVRTGCLLKSSVDRRYSLFAVNVG